MKHGPPAEEEEYTFWRVWEGKYEPTSLPGKKNGSGTLSMPVLQGGNMGSTSLSTFGADLLKEARYVLMQTIADSREAEKGRWCPCQQEMRVPDIASQESPPIP